ncbi:MAG: hypothetical protein SLRJCFUN_001023 [Candidatus Fervidibacter sp.]
MGFARRGTLVVAKSHSNKDEQPDAPSSLLLERRLAATMLRKWRCDNGNVRCDEQRLFKA